eukprot:m.120421 g.120421  ORF g.120421 m.120421 type:complete len:733 (-) comp14358_c0_seq1:84-2282(-)
MAVEITDPAELKLHLELSVVPATEFPKSQCTRWFTNKEVASILVGALSRPDWQSTKALNRPDPGSVFLYDRQKVKFRRDGYNWKKRKDGRTQREDHAKLKIGGKNVIYGCYAHSEDDHLLHRRCYWLLSDPQIVFVHYLSTTEKKPSVKQEPLQEQDATKGYKPVDAQTAANRAHLALNSNTNQRVLLEADLMVASDQRVHSNKRGLTDPRSPTTHVNDQRARMAASGNKIPSGGNPKIVRLLDSPTENGLNMYGNVEDASELFDLLELSVEPQHEPRKQARNMDRSERDTPSSLIPDTADWNMPWNLSHNTDMSQLLNESDDFFHQQAQQQIDMRVDEMLNEMSLSLSDDTPKLETRPRSYSLPKDCSVATNNTPRMSSGASKKGLAPSMSRRVPRVAKPVTGTKVGMKSAKSRVARTTIQHKGTCPQCLCARQIPRSNNEFVNIVEFCPKNAFIKIPTQVLVIGPWFANSKYTCTVQGITVDTIMVQPGVLSCLAYSEVPGTASLAVYEDGQLTSFSVPFEFRAVPTPKESKPVLEANQMKSDDENASSQKKPSSRNLQGMTWRDFLDEEGQKRLAGLSLEAGKKGSLEDKKKGLLVEKRQEFKAAKTIQQAFKKYMMQIQKEKGAKERKIKANDDAEETEGEVREAAAVTIQAQFRAYKEREQYQRTKQGVVKLQRIFRQKYQREDAKLKKGSRMARADTEGVIPDRDAKSSRQIARTIRHNQSRNLTL